jgi:hypothetical protein
LCNNYKNNQKNNNMKTTTTTPVTTTKVAQFSAAELSKQLNAKEKLQAEAKKIAKVNTTKVTETETAHEVLVLPKVKNKPTPTPVVTPVSEVADEPVVFPFKEEDIVTFVNNSGVKVKAQVLWIWYVKSTKKVRTRVIMLDEKNKLTNEHVSFVASRATLTTQVAKESTKVKYKQIKAKPVAEVVAKPIVAEVVAKPVVSLVEMVSNNAKPQKGK